MPALGTHLPCLWLEDIIRMGLEMLSQSVKIVSKRQQRARILAAVHDHGGDLAAATAAIGATSLAEQQLGDALLAAPLSSQLSSQLTDGGGEDNTDADADSP
jgi:hypothetical protein